MIVNRQTRAKKTNHKSQIPNSKYQNQEPRTKNRETQNQQPTPDN